MHSPGRALSGDLFAQMAELQEQGRNVLLAGPNGTGRSYLLSTAEHRLRRQGVRTLLLDCADPGASDRLAGAERNEVLLLDNLEHADLNLLGLIAGWLDVGGASIGSFDPTNQDSSFTSTLGGFGVAAERARAVLDAFRVLELNRFSDDDLERFLHEQSPEPLDSSTIHAIITLAEGRIRWAMDLLELTSARLLLHFPRPSVADVSFGDPRFPSLRSVARSVGTLSPEAAAVAVVLSETEPMDLASAEDLAGSEPVSILQRRGALFRDPLHNLFYIPPFIAAAVRYQAPPSLVDRFQNALADRFIGKTSFGLPLSEAEALLCVRSRKAGQGQARSSQSDWKAWRSVFHRVIANLADFGEQTLASTLLLRADDPDLFPDPLHRAKVLGALAGPEAGLCELDHVPASSDSSRQVAVLYLRTLLHSRSSSTVTEPEADRIGDASDSAREDAQAVLRMWSTTSSIAAEIPRLRKVSHGRDEQGVWLLAESLADLDEAWRGLLPEGSWLASGAPLPQADVVDSEASQYLSNTLLLAHALTCLLAGEYAARGEELQRSVDHASPREYHQRWMRHFHAAGTALACGDLQRSKLEWTHLLSRAPKFLPLRLHRYLNGIHRALRTATDPNATFLALETPDDEMVYRVIHYLSGKHMALARQNVVNQDDPRALPVLRTGAMHISAVEAENPTELIRIADRLQRLDLWAPAAFALTKAREIFLSRRMVRGVRQSNDRIARLEQRLQQRVLWYRGGAFPVSDYIKLTPRERLTASLAAEGLSNREIAERLHCSVRTVESHLAQARAKLGAATRKELGDLPDLQRDR